MNVTALHDELANLGGPVEHPTAQDRNAVRRRGQRARAGRVAGAVAAMIVIGLTALLLVAPWSGNGGDARVVTAAGTTIHDERLGYTVTVPPGWKRIPRVVGPRTQLPTILELHSDDYTAPTIRGSCATSTEQTGINIGLQESNTRSIDDFTRKADRRPEHFGPDSFPPLRTNPGSPLCRRLEQGISFVDGDRHFYVGITMAPGTSPARQAEVYEMLDSLRFDDDTIVEHVRS